MSLADKCFPAVDGYGDKDIAILRDDVREAVNKLRKNLRFIADEDGALHISIVLNEVDEVFGFKEKEEKE